MKMNFLKGLMVVAAGALMLGTTGCKKDKPSGYKAAYIDILIDGKVDSTPSIPSVSFEGDEISIQVKSNRDWEMTSTLPEWLDMTPKAGDADRTTPVEITVDPNDETGSAPRNFDIVFKTTDGEKTQTLKVSQQGDGGIDPTEYVFPTPEAIYYEDAGDDVEKNEDDRWPGVEDFDAYTRGGDVDQSGVVYAGKASVCNSGENWDPTEIDPTAPYFYLGANAANAQPLKINGIATGGATNLTLRWIMQDTDFTEDVAPYTPTMRPVTTETVTLGIGYDGAYYDTTNPKYTIGESLGNGWTVVSAEFKVETGTEEIFVKLDGYSNSNSQGLRLDNFELVEGGDGPQITIEGGDAFGNGLVAIADLNANWVNDFTIPANTYIEGTVVSDAAGGNGYTHSINVVDATTANSGTYIFGFEDAEGEFVNHSFVTGDVVKVVLDGATLTTFNGLREVTGVLLTNATKTTGTALTTPVEVAASADLGNYQSMLVSIECSPLAANVGKNYVGSGNTTLKFTDSADTEFDVFTRSTATFKSETVTDKSGNLVGIVGAYNTVQLMPRNAGDLAGMDGASIPVFTVSTQAVSVPFEGGNASVNVLGNVAWTAVLGTNGAGASISSGASGTGEGTVTLNFPANSDDVEKTTTVIISTTADATPDSYTVTFTQAPSGVTVKTVNFTFSADDTGQGTGSSGKNAVNKTQDDIQLEISKGTNNFPFYHSSGQLRMYGGTIITVTALNSKTITAIKFVDITAPGNAITANVGTYVDSATGGWTGSASKVIFTEAGTTGNRGLSSIEVTYE